MFWYKIGGRSKGNNHGYFALIVEAQSESEAEKKSRVEASKLNNGGIIYEFMKLHGGLVGFPTREVVQADASRAIARKLGLRRRHYSK